MPPTPKKYIYYYYMQVTGNPELETRVYVLEKKLANVEDEIKSRFAEIDSGSHTPSGWKIGDIRWRHRAHLVFIFDHPTIVLDPNNPVIIAPSHSFSSRSYLTIKAEANRKVTACYCFNNMKQVNQQDDVDSVNGEKITIKANHALAAADPKTGRRGHEDTGTNLGPPVGG